jgi:hypothetical protein
MKPGYKVAECAGWGWEKVLVRGDKAHKTEKKTTVCMCTGTPTFGLPPVFSGPVAVFIACVYAVFDRGFYMLVHGGYYSNHATNSRTHGV